MPLFSLNPDALDDAKTIDRRRAAGEKLGPLAGVPVVIKDPMDMVGFPTTAGWSLLYSKTGGVDLMPATDSPVVARMRAAGAVILGKTNVPVLSHSRAATPMTVGRDRRSTSQCPTGFQAAAAPGQRPRSPQAWPCLG